MKRFCPTIPGYNRLLRHISFKIYLRLFYEYWADCQWSFEVKSTWQSDACRDFVGKPWNPVFCSAVAFRWWGDSVSKTVRDSEIENGEVEPLSYTQLMARLRSAGWVSSSHWAGITRPTSGKAGTYDYRFYRLSCSSKSSAKLLNFVKKA